MNAIFPKIEHFQYRVDMRQNVLVVITHGLFSTCFKQATRTGKPLQGCLFRLRQTRRITEPTVKNYIIRNKLVRQTAIGAELSSNDKFLIDRRAT